MTSESWFAIDSDDSPLRNRKITTVVLGSTATIWSKLPLRPLLRQLHAALRPVAPLHYAIVGVLAAWPVALLGRRKMPDWGGE